jgi:cytosine/creatinine deaminase
MERLYDMVTVDAARAMNVQDFGLVVGNRADLVVLDAGDVLEALREHAPPAYVISHGKVVDAAKMRALAAA